MHGADDAGTVLSKVAESGETELLARLIKTDKFDAGTLTRALMSAKPDDAKTIAMLTEAGDVTLELDIDRNILLIGETGKITLLE